LTRSPEESINQSIDRSIDQSINQSSTLSSRRSPPPLSFFAVACVPELVLVLVLLACRDEYNRPLVVCRPGCVLADTVLRPSAMERNATTTNAPPTTAPSSAHRNCEGRYYDLDISSCFLNGFSFFFLLGGSSCCLMRGPAGVPLVSRIFPAAWRGVGGCDENLDALLAVGVLVT